MANGKVHIHGLRALGAAMQSLSLDVALKHASAAASAGARVVASEARRSAPKDTGNLARNVITKRLRRSETDVTAETIVTVRKGRVTAKQRQRGLRDAYYASWVEFGTVNAPAQPFLAPALPRVRANAEQAMAQSLQRRILKATT